MDAEWSVDHDLLQHQDNFTELAEDEAGGPAERGRACARACRSSTELAVLMQAAGRVTPASY